MLTIAPCFGWLWNKSF